MKKLNFLWIAAIAAIIGFSITACGENDVLSAPYNARASAESTSSIIISWGSVSGATEYRIYRSLNQTVFSHLGTTFLTEYTDTELSANTTYYYRVTAYNSSGESSQSNTASARTSSIGTPTGVRATATSTSSITVSWNSVSGATGYNIYRNISGSYTQVGTSTTTSYTDTGLTADTTYYYRVTASTSAGESSQSGNVSATTSSISTPTGMRFFYNSATSVTVSWNAVSGVTGYRIYRNESLIGTSESASYTDTGLSTATTYYYQVSAYSSGGESRRSGYSTRTPNSPGLYYNLDNIVLLGVNPYYLTPGAEHTITVNVPAGRRLNVEWCDIDMPIGNYGIDNYADVMVGIRRGANTWDVTVQNQGNVGTNEHGTTPRTTSTAGQHTIVIRGLNATASGIYEILVTVW